MIPQRAVLDTSVIALWFIPEDNLRELALLIRKRYIMGCIQLAVPDLVLTELEHVLQTKLGCDDERVQSALATLQQMDLSIIPWSDEVGRAAALLTLQCPITIFDAYFLALATELQYAYITADARLYACVQHIPSVILLSNLR